MNTVDSPFRLFDASQTRRFARAMSDLRDGFGHWRLAVAFAWGDIKHRYRGSVLGPFWVTLTTVAIIVALGFYNLRRRHSALGGKSPLAFERQAA